MTSSIAYARSRKIAPFSSLRAISDLSKSTANELLVSRVKKKVLRMPFYVELEAPHLNGFRNTIKVESVFEFCQKAQHRDGVSTGQNVRPHLDISFLLEKKHMSGKVLIDSIAAD